MISIPLLSFPHRIERVHYRPSSLKRSALGAIEDHLPSMVSFFAERTSEPGSGEVPERLKLQSVPPRFQFFGKEIATGDLTLLTPHAAAIGS